MKKILIVLVMFFSVSAFSADWIYTIRPNDTIESVVKRYLVDDIYIDLVIKHNDIKNPKKLVPGQRIGIPYHWLAIKPLNVKVEHLTGSVFKIFTDETGTEVKSTVRIGEEFSLGQRVVTEENSSVILLFADGSTIQLKENSDVEFDLLRSYGEEGMVDSKLLLKKGRVDVKANPQQREQGIYRFEITTPAAISAVRGTAFGMSFDEKQATVELFDGKNIVKQFDAQHVKDQHKAELITEDGADSGDQVTLTSGKGTFVVEGQPPAPPQTLLPAPAAESIDADRLENHERLIQWAAIPGAARYNVEFSNNQQMQGIIWSDTVNSPQLVPDFIKSDTMLYMRLSGIDSNGIMGFATVVPVQPQLYPHAPNTYTPSQSYWANEEEVLFSWKAGKDEKFRLQVAEDLEFVRVKADEVVQGDRKVINFADFREGVYYWRISGIGEDNQPGQASLPVQFVYAVNETLEKSDDGNKIIMPDVASIKGYNLQIFKDEDGYDKLWESRFEGNELIIPDHLTGKLFYRIAVINENGEVGNYTELKQLEQPQKWWQIMLIASLGFLAFI